MLWEAWPGVAAEEGTLAEALKGNWGCEAVRRIVASAAEVPKPHHRTLTVAPNPLIGLALTLLLTNLSPSPNPKPRRLTLSLAPNPNPNPD